MNSDADFTPASLWTNSTADLVLTWLNSASLLLYSCIPLSAVEAQFVIISAASVVTALIFSKVSLDCLALVSAISRNCCGASGLGERAGVVLGLVFIRPFLLEIWIG